MKGFWEECAARNWKEEELVVLRWISTGLRLSETASGMSLTSVAKKYRVSRATVCRLVNESVGRQKAGVPQNVSREAAIAPPGAVDLIAA